ncbi:MAG: hypothetical protein ABSG76_12455 [Xanthobacteraceae bacterium]|jgi:hypothetical protein
MDGVGKLFEPAVGLFVWNVRRCHGSFLTMELGMPHLSVREPIAPRHARSPRLRRDLERRKIHVVGDWHLWVRYGAWELSTAHGVLDSTSPAGSIGDECLADLDGQRLRSVAPGRMPSSCAFTFDLGGSLEVWPSTRLPDDQWSLHGRDGSVAAFQSDGTLVVDKATAKLR